MTSPYRVFVYVLASLFELFNQLLDFHEVFYDHYAMKGHSSLHALEYVIIGNNTAHE